MNILIDLRWMTIGRAGGMEQMAFELVSAIAGVNREDLLRLYCPRRTFEEWVFDSGSKVELIDSDRIRLAPERSLFDTSENREPGDSKRLGLVARGARETVESRIIEVDLVHSIGGYVCEELRQYPNVLTVHDLQHVHFSENFDEAELGARNASYAASLRVAKAVICVSESVRRDVLERFDVSPSNVSTIWNIPSGSSLGRLPDTCVAKALKRMGVDSDFVFFPSHGWPHKNHELLVDAFSKVRENLPQLTLVFTGGKFGHDHPAAKRVRELGLENAVRHLGFRTPLEIRCLYQGALALVYPSLFEGFGMPVAEAILAGTPVACSNIDPLLEVGGDAALTFDPEDADDVAETILAVVQDSALKESQLRKGVERRQRFSPEAIAIETCNLYRRICGLEPVAYRPLALKGELRREKAQHWGRLYQSRMQGGQALESVAAWLAAFWNSPSMAMRLLRSGKIKEKASSKEAFLGRYGDAWIGLVFLDWLMVPDGAKRLEFEFEAPPEPFCEALVFRISVGEGEALEVGFEGRSELKVKIELPADHGALIRIRIECDRSFVPKEQGLSEDERELAMKLVGVRWLR